MLGWKTPVEKPMAVSSPGDVISLRDMDDSGDMVCTGDVTGFRMWLALGTQLALGIGSVLAIRLGFGMWIVLGCGWSWQQG